MSENYLGPRSTMYDEELRLRRKALFFQIVFYGSLLLNFVLAIKLVSARMGL